MGAFPFSELDFLQNQCLAFLGILLAQQWGNGAARTGFVALKAPFLIALKSSWVPGLGAGVLGGKAGTQHWVYLG